MVGLLNVSIVNLCAYIRYEIAGLRRLVQCSRTDLHSISSNNPLDFTLLRRIYQPHAGGFLRGQYTGRFRGSACVTIAKLWIYFGAVYGKNKRFSSYSKLLTMEGGLGPQYSSSAILEGIERLGLGLACRTPRLRIFCRQVNNTSKPRESHS